MSRVRSGRGAGPSGDSIPCLVVTDPALPEPAQRPAGDPAGPPSPEARPSLEVQIVRLDPGLEPPGYARPGDAGADLRTRVDVELAPGERRTVPTGVAVALPEGYAGFVHPRSGLAARFGLTVVNAPGTIDAGYRGEISVTLLNTDGDRPVRLARGDRIAQLVVQRVEFVRFVEVEQLPPSERGAAGFGSTGGIAGAKPFPGTETLVDLESPDRQGERAIPVVAAQEERS